jgi:hypothetical protein
MKIGIIGTGAGGTACAFATVTRGFASRVVLIDLDRKRARGVVTDLQHGAVLSPAVTLIEGDYLDLSGADLVILSACVNEPAGGATDRRDPSGRLRLLEANAAVYRDVVPRVVEAAPKAVILVVTDRLDPLADLARRLGGHDRVLSTGTYLDSLRFQFHLAKHLECVPACKRQPTDESLALRERSCLEQMVSDLPRALDGTGIEPLDRVGDDGMQALSARGRDTGKERLTHKFMSESERLLWSLGAWDREAST